MTDREAPGEGVEPGPPDYAADGTLRPDRPVPGSPEEPVDAEAPPTGEKGVRDEPSPYSDWVEELGQEGTDVGPIERDAQERRN